MLSQSIQGDASLRLNIKSFRASLPHIGKNKLEQIAIRRMNVNWSFREYFFRSRSPTRQLLELFDDNGATVTHWPSKIVKSVN